MKNKDRGEGEGGGGGLNRKGAVINFPPVKRGVLTREGGLFERGWLNRGFLVINRQQNSLPCCDSLEL